MDIQENIDIQAVIQEVAQKSQNGNEIQVVGGGFEPSAVDQARSIARINPASFVDSRLDLRYHTMLTFASDAVSPAQYALSISKNGDSQRLGIHIADVSELICESTPLDFEARHRAASIDTENGLRDMLPLNLVWETFNLREGEEKLTYTIFIDVDFEGRLTDIQFEKSISRADRRCLYGELDALRVSSDASSVMALRKKYEKFIPMIDEMYSLAALLRRERYNRGGMQTDKFRRKYLLDDNAEVIELRHEICSDSEDMIAEILLFIADSVGKYAEKQGFPAVYLGQEVPSDEVIEQLARVAGVKLDSELPPERRISTLIDLCRGTEKHALICDELRFSMPFQNYSTKPTYNCLTATNTVARLDSPVTSYPDLLAQRLLKLALTADESEEEAVKSQAEYYSAIAETASRGRVGAEKVYDKRRRRALNCPGMIVPGYLFDITPDGAEVLMENNAQGRIDGDFNGLRYGKKYLFKVITPEPRLVVEPVGEV